MTRLLALAHRFEKLIRDGEVQGYADLARLGHVSRARLSQIMNLLNLAPDIQEEILLLPAVIEGDDPVRERQLRGIVAVLDWGNQRPMWQRDQRLSVKPDGTPGHEGRNRETHKPLAEAHARP